MLGTVLVGRDALVPPQVSLSVFGKIVQKYIEKSGSVYDGVFVDHYAIMPNHVHLLLRMEHTDGGTGASRPTAIKIVKAIKSLSSREIGHSIWQTSYYDHVIRNQKDYDETWTYIENNPAQWADDEYYCEESR